MSESWDVIVVGAGVGGLTAAARLAQAGLQVLIVEKNPHPGGTAYVYTRAGFRFPMGPLGFSNMDRVGDILRDLGVGEAPLFHRVHYRIHAFGLKLPISLPYAELSRELARRFPNEAAGLEQFFRDIGKRLSTLSFPESNKCADPIQETGGLSAAEYLHGHIQDGRLRRILGSLGTREPYSNLSLLAAMWNLMSREGIGYPDGGMQLFCDRLAEAVSGQGSGQVSRVGPAKKVRAEIRFGSAVKNIRLEKNKVVGVTMEDSTRIDCAAVISNTDYKATFLGLIDPQAIPPEHLRKVLQAKQTGSILQVCLGVDAGLLDLGLFEEASRVIYRRTLSEQDEEKSIAWDGAEIDSESLAAQELEISLWSREDKRLAPEGGAVIVIRADMEYSHFAHFRTGWRKRFSYYQQYKNRLGRALVMEAASMIPGLERGIRVIDIATPLTFQDQGGRSEGAVAGWSWDHRDFRENQPRELVRTPVQGLYMAGYQAFSALFLGGIATAMESGMRAAEAVLQGLGPVNHIQLPGVARGEDECPS